MKQDVSKDKDWGSTVPLKSLRVASGESVLPGNLARYQPAF